MVPGDLNFSPEEPMLKPETARTILNLALNLGLVGIGVTLAVLLWIMLTGGS